MDHITKYVFLLVFCFLVRTIQIYTLGKFQVHNIVLLTIVTILNYFFYVTILDYF